MSVSKHVFCSVPLRNEFHPLVGGAELKKKKKREEKIRVSIHLQHVTILAAFPLILSPGTQKWPKTSDSSFKNEPKKNKVYIEQAEKFY